MPRTNVARDTPPPHTHTHHLPPTSPHLTHPPHPHQAVNKMGDGFASRVHACAGRVCEVLAGPEGLGAEGSREAQRGACKALGAAMTAAPSAMFEPVQVSHNQGGSRRHGGRGEGGRPGGRGAGDGLAPSLRRCRCSSRVGRGRGGRGVLGWRDLHVV